uniref:Uncharacterized protein n=1 Tax=Picea sitchensis TaxID=3332 RepID=D5A9J2_PICSI|nr:unknown [Picea sitchensis]
MFCFPSAINTHKSCRGATEGIHRPDCEPPLGYKVSCFFYLHSIHGKFLFVSIFPSLLGDIDRVLPCVFYRG